MKRVFVTGMGVISALGNGLAEQITALQNSRSGIRKICNLDSIHKGVLPAAEIEYSNEDLKSLIPNLDSSESYTRGQLLSLIAVNEAIATANLSPEDIKELTIVSSNTIGSMDYTEKYYRDYRPELQYYFNKAHSIGETSRRIAHYLQTEGLITTISTACSSSANAIMLGSKLIRSGRAKRVLVGGSDSITKFSVDGFTSLLIYDENVCKPFDKNRNGLNLGEAGAYLILESEDVLGNKQSFGEIVAYANRNEAYHATASSPEGEGAYLTMKQAIEKANLSSEDISFVHAHGTATPTNDESELNALKRIFKHKIPAFASSKSYVGHTLGAAGALNAIYTLLAMQHSFLFENLNFDESIDGINEPIRKFTSNFPIQYAISNAFGFGGNNNSIVFANTQKGGSNAI
ncbi:MAG: beta-ketoacyl-[acyl-carrier-protein] synthase family protein [Bacteroidetes bacterium]|nr:MAG: beta-ketoacyl-[acyl-carrier-protein] synthase family protein [Bacteroidota bacterium]